jgi:DNA-directed RNA polymerase subunit RPC12/RpoP
MPFTVTCTCGKKLSAREEHVGKRAKCPQCGQMLLIAPKSAAKAPKEAAVAGATPHHDVSKLDPWFDLLASDDPSQRKKGADHLAAVGPDAAHELPVLIRRSTSENMLIRHWAVACIGHIGPVAKGALAALMDRLGDDEPLVREKAAKAIEHVLPEAKPFVSALLHGLEEKDDHRRAAAIELFRRNLKTTGISRFRFWACTCGRVYIKVDLEQRLRKMVDAADEVSWEGKRSCGQCGAHYEDRDIYAGKHDVPEQHWSRLRTKFGPHLSVPDDFLDDTREDAGYRISDDAASQHVDLSIPSLAPFSIALESPALEGEQGYAISASAPPPVYGVLGQQHGKETVELVPGVEVPKSGKYKCTSCAKKRLKAASEASAGPTPPRASIVMQFKAGKTFAECPNCRDLTEWEWLG